MKSQTRSNVWLAGLTVLIFLFLMTAITGCNKPEKGPQGTGAQGTQSTANRTVRVPLYTPGSGGTAYVLGAGMAKILNESVPGVQVVVEATEGSGPINRYLVEKAKEGVPALGEPGSDALYKAYNGIGDYKEPLKELRAISFVYGVNIYPVVAAESNIKSYEDFAGKRVAVGAPGSGVALAVEEFLRMHGLEGKYQKLYLGYTEVVDGIKNGSIDVGHLAGGYPIPAFTELSLAKPVRIIGLSEEMAKKIEASGYYLTAVVKAGSYEGRIKEDVIVPGFGSMLATHEKAPADLIYSITKTLFEKRSELERVHPSAKEMTLENALKAVGIPLHPGAERYYREVGVLK